MRLQGRHIFSFFIPLYHFLLNDKRIKDILTQKIYIYIFCERVISHSDKKSFSHSDKKCFQEIKRNSRFQLYMQAYVHTLMLHFCSSFSFKTI